MNRPTITNRISAAEVRHMCIKYNYCNACSNSEYARLLNRFDKYGEYTGLTDTLIDLAMLICRYTDGYDETDTEEVKGVIMMILNNALIWSYTD